jgi:Putative TM nitroreductase
MAQINPAWYAAIASRRSRRSYEKGKQIEPGPREQLGEVCKSFRPYPCARVEFIAEPPDDIFANALGFYGNVKNAPAFLAFIGDTSDPNVQEKMGYTGEAAVLEATRLGLGTCWVALTYNTKSVSSIINLKGTEKLLSVSPIGYTIEKWTFEEKMFTAFGAMHQRKPLSIMTTGIKELQRAAWSQAAVEAARLAPSATNRQPWNFDVEDDGITISIKNTGMEFNVSKRLDCGIAMLHIELGAMSAGVSGGWEFLKQPQVARFKIK